MFNNVPFILFFMRRGQSAFEHLALMGIILLFVVALFYYSTTFALSNYREKQAEDTLHSLLITALAVHELGAGNRENVVVQVPEDVHLVAYANELLASDEDGAFNVSISTPFDVIGSIPSVEGLAMVNVKAVNETLVKIGKWPEIYLLQPSWIALSDPFPTTRVYMVGDDLDDAISVLVDGNLYTYAPLIIHLNATYAYFLASKTYFNVTMNTTVAYDISLLNSEGYSSNALQLEVFSPVV